MFLQADNALLILSSMNEAININMSSLNSPPFLHMQLGLLSDSPTELTVKTDIFGGRCSWQCLRCYDPQLVTEMWKLSEHQSLVRSLHPINQTSCRRNPGLQCKTIHLQYLSSESPSESELYITFNIGLLRFLLWPWLLNHIRPPGLKHVSSEMEIELASGGYGPRGEVTTVD